MTPGRAAAAALALLLPGLASPPAASAQAPPAAEPAASAERSVTAIEITGVTRFDKETVWETLGVKPGGRLRRDPAELSSLLEEHYRTLGYAAVRVRSGFDEATGTLRVSVDEGVLGAVGVTGVSGGERERVLGILELAPGKPFNDEEVADALRRLESATSGAFEAAGEPPYVIARDEGTVRLDVQLRQRPARFRIAPGGTGMAPLVNRVDGWAPGVSTEALLFLPSAFNPVEVYGLANYALTPEKVRYAVGVRRVFGATGVLALGYEHHDFTDTDDVFRSSGVEHLRGPHFFFNVFRDYYRRRGDEAFAFVRASPRVQMGVNFRSDEFESQPRVPEGTFLLWQDPPDNPPVDEGRSRSFLFTARWAARAPLFESWGEERTALLVRDPYGTPFRRGQGLRAEGTLEAADADALGGDFTFRRFTGHVRGAARLSLRNWLMGRLTAGAGSEGLPVQRRFSLGGPGTLRGRAREDVEGDRMVLASAEWHFEPNAPLPAVIAFYDGGTAWDVDGERPPWRHDAGLGLAWPPGENQFVRVDAALALNATGGSRPLRVSGYVRLPF